MACLRVGGGNEGVISPFGFFVHRRFIKDTTTAIAVILANSISIDDSHAWLLNRIQLSLEKIFLFFFFMYTYTTSKTSIGQSNVISTEAQ